MSSLAKYEKRGDAKLLKELLEMTESFTNSGSWIWQFPERKLYSSTSCLQLLAADQDAQVSPESLLKRMNKRDQKRFGQQLEALIQRQEGFDDEYLVLDYEGDWQRLRIVVKVEQKGPGHWQVKGIYQIVEETTDQVKSFAAMQKEYILQVLQQTGGRVSGPKGAAKLLDINSKTLFAKMKKLGINKDEYAPKK